MRDLPDLNQAYLTHARVRARMLTLAHTLPRARAQVKGRERSYFCRVAYPDACDAWVKYIEVGRPREELLEQWIQAQEKSSESAFPLRRGSRDVLPRGGVADGPGFLWLYRRREVDLQRKCPIRRPSDGTINWSNMRSNPSVASSRRFTMRMPLVVGPRARAHSSRAGQRAP